MNKIIETIDSNESFDDLSKILNNKEYITSVSSFLNDQNLSIPARVFLSAFMINLYPKDTIGNIGELKEEGFVVEHSDKDNIVIEKANELVIYCRNNYSNKDQQFKNLTELFEKAFNDWKEDDKDKFKMSLINEYHSLTVGIMNAPEEAKESLRKCQEGLLETAKMVGGTQFVDEILQYTPVVLDTEELLKTYTQAFWDLLTEEYKEKKYDKIFVVLEHLVQLLITIKPNNESEIKDNIDVDFIKQQLNHDAFSTEQMYGLCQYIMTTCHDCQAPQFDQNIEILNQHLKDENFLPLFLKEISMILQITADDVIKIREELAKAKEEEN